MKRSTLAPIPTTLAFSALLVSPAFATDAAPPAVDTQSETYRKAYEKAYAEALAKRNAGSAETPPARSAEAGKGTGETKIAEVTVTAGREPAKPGYKAESADIRRATPLKDTPQQVSVVSREVLQDRNATDLKQAVRNSPGITFNAGEGGNSGGDNFNLRGFNARSDIFVDGVRDASLMSRDTFATEQVEIAKGSSGVYQGRGSTGGSINLVSKAPRAGHSGELALTASTANSLRAEADANLDLSKEIDRLRDAGVAARVTAVAQDGGTPRSADLSDRRVGVMPSVAVGVGKDTTVTLSHLHLEQDRDPDYGIPFGTNAGMGMTQQPAPVSYSNRYGIEGFDRDNTVQDITTAELRTRLDDYNTLRNITRYNQNARDTVINRPGAGGINAAAGTITLSPTSRFTDDTTLSNLTDLVSQFKTGAVAHTLNVGAELQQEQATNRARTITGTVTQNLYNPNAFVTPTQGIAFSGARTVANAETYALYVNETLHASRFVDLIGGLRYDHFEAAQKNYPATGSTTATTSFDRSDDMLGWRTGLVLKPTETVSLYATVANSFNPSAGDLALAANTQDLKPEETYLYEIGAKWEAVKERLFLGAAFFVADKFNLRQTVDPVLGTQDLTGRAVSQGVELSATGAITKKWNVIGGVSFIDSEVKESATAANEGKALTNTPEWSATLWTTYDFGSGWSAGVGARYIGDRWGDAANTVTLQDYIVTDLMIAKQINRHCRLQLNVDNLTDERYIETARVATNGNSWATPGAGRTLSGTVRLSF